MVALNTPALGVFFYQCLKGTVVEKQKLQNQNEMVIFQLNHVLELLSNSQPSRTENKLYLCTLTLGRMGQSMNCSLH